MARRTGSPRAPLPADGMVDNPNSPAVRKRQVSARNMRRMLMGTLVTVTVLVVLLALSWMTVLLRPPQAASVSSASVNQSPGKVVAEQTVSDWLLHDPSPIPGGMVASWDGVETTPSPAQEAGVDVSAEDGGGNLPNYASELHYFTVLAEDDAYTVTVLVETNPDLGARVRSQPSVIRVAPSAVTGEAWGTEVTWHGWSPGNVPTPVVDSATSWAFAYTSGDPVQLRMTVGDPDSNHAYMPLGKADQSTVKLDVLEGAHRKPEQADGAVDSSTMLLRVELRADLSGEKLGENEDVSKQAAMAFDLLVTGADTASPRVVSWGPAGTGPTLSEYSVAIAGRDIKLDDSEKEPEGTPEPDQTTDVDPSAAPSPIPTPSPSPTSNKQ